jgi:hypothetical protein
MSIPLYCNGHESGTLAYPYFVKNRAAAKRKHKDSRREFRLATAVKTLQGLFGDDNYRSAFTCLFYPRKETIPCGLI